MGQFSWLTQDTDLQIGSHRSNTIIVYMYDDKGNKWKESDYNGYGDFGGKDFYDLLAEMNGFTKDNVKGDLRNKGIDLYFDKDWSDKGYISPALMESETLPEGHSFELKPAYDPNQSWPHYADGGKVDNYSEIETFVQLESDSDQNIRYMMVGTQGDKGFNGWIIDYGGGGNFDEFWFADGENLEGIVSGETNGDYDYDMVEDKFIERTRYGFLEEIEKIKHELIRYDGDLPNHYYPMLRSKPTHNHRVFDALTGETEGYIIPITVGNTIFEDDYADGGELDSVKDTKEHLGFDDKEWNRLTADLKTELRRKSHKDLQSGKKQGYADKEDESLGMRTGKESSKKQSYKARREDSYGKWGKRDSERKGKDKKTKTTSTTGLAILGIVIGILIGRQIKLN